MVQIKDDACIIQMTLFMDDPCFVDGGVLVVALLVAVPPVTHSELVQQQLKLEERGLIF